MQVEFNDEGDGFWATFDNGWTMSVQWRPGTHAGGNTVEIAAWNEGDTVWWDFEEGKPEPPNTAVLGWVTSDELGEYMNDIASITRSSEGFFRLPYNPLRATVGDILSPKMNLRTDEE